MYVVSPLLLGKGLSCDVTTRQQQTTPPLAHSPQAQQLEQQGFETRQTHLEPQFFFFLLTIIYKQTTRTERHRWPPTTQW
jgi:hypothetical protein